MVRRMLLIIVTGLLVARPFVNGEDPTLQAKLEDLDASSMILTIIWFVAAVLWAIWRLWSGKGTWHGGLIEAALLVVVGLTFFGAYMVAPYRHPARLMAWEWLGIVAGFFLIRQLAATREEQHLFFTVLLAGMVVLSVYALFQRGFEFPRIQQLYGTREKLYEAELARSGSVDPALLETKLKRIKDTFVFGPFANPNSFGAYLALFLPGLIGAALLCARHKHPRWQVMLTSSFATLGVVALGLTVSRGAWLGTLLAGLGVIVVVWRRWLRHNWYYAVAVVVVLGLLAFGLTQTKLLTEDVGKTEGTALVRIREYWPATWQMILQHPWFGVGPGQFGHFYPRYMAITAGETIKEPHNFILEIWATGGVFALIALLVALGLFYRYALRALLRAPTVDGPGDVPPPERPTGEPTVPVRWEFYLGGMFGLVLAFVLRAVDLSRDDLIEETVKAGVGSLFWFGAFALFEQIRWSNRARLLALAGGVTATLLTLLVEGGINFPSVAGPLWCAVALALNSAELPPKTWGNQSRALLALPLLLFAAVIGYYLYSVFYPVNNADHAMKIAMDNLHDPDKRPREETMPDGSKKRFMLSFPGMIEQLEKARKKADTDNAALDLLLANLSLHAWQGAGGQPANDDEPTGGRKINYRREALQYAKQVQQLDPDGRDGYLNEYGLRVAFAEFHNREMRELIQPSPSMSMALGLAGRRAAVQANKTKPQYQEFLKEQQIQYSKAAEPLKEFLNKDPNDPRLHFQLAVVLYLAGRPDEAEPIAKRALELAEINKYPTRTLTGEQKRQLQQLIKDRGRN
jgi:O-antigen ligase/tetratricopeptide (TPR) repeat protein